MMKKMTKNEIAKQLGVTRQTVYKMIKEGKPITLPELDIESKKLCIHFSAKNNSISPIDLENILEDLQDFGFLNEKGIRFRSSYWQLFIKR